MFSQRIIKIFGAAIGLSMFSAGSAMAALSATSTISSTPDGPNFDYTVSVTNTGTTNIGTFWFAWTPPLNPTEYDFLPTAPSAAAGPAGWVAPLVSGFPGTSIEYYNVSGSAIAPGGTGTFTFTSSDSPATLQGKQFGTFPITESFIYAGAPESGAFAQVNPVFSVPEPTSAALLALTGCAIAARRRRAVV